MSPENYNYDGDDEQYCAVYINALRTNAFVMQMDNNFVLDLAERTKGWIVDGDLNDEELKKLG